METGIRFKSHLLFTAAVLLIISFTIPANAQKLHIDSVNCEVNETDTSYLNKMVRHEGQFYDRVFDTHINDTAAVNITLYGKSSVYNKALKANKLKNVTNGMYSPVLNKTLAFKNELYMHVVLRAANDNLLRINYPKAPRWLIEGTDAVMSYIDEDGDRQVIYTPSFDDNKTLKQLTWSDEGIDFDALFTDDSPDWSGRSSVAKLRTEAFGIIYFLVTEQPDHLAPIVAAMKQGKTTQDAIAGSFGDFDNFKKLFTLYYRYRAKSKFSMASM